MSKNKKHCDHFNCNYTCGGQTGPNARLPYGSLSDKQLAVVHAMWNLHQYNGGQPVTLAQIAALAFPQLGPAMGNSWVRNQLRLLVRGNWATKGSGAGIYTLTEMGQARMRRATGAKVAAPVKRTPEEILGVAPGSGYAVAKYAWRKRASETHLDRGGDPEAAKDVNEAWQALCHRMGWDQHSRKAA